MVDVGSVSCGDSNISILITGAGGFVGQELCQYFAKSDIDFVGVTRSPSQHYHRTVGTFCSATDWREHLKGVTTVFHLAGRAHMKDNSSEDARREFNTINVEATKKLLVDCAVRGVKHFIYVSSIKVLGETSAPGMPINEDVTPCPEDPYGVSKLMAEGIVKHFCRQHDIRFTIVRPTLIVGKGAKANLSALKSVLVKGFPLPLFSSTNQRSLIHIRNMITFLSAIVTNEASYDQTFNLAEDKFFSTAEIIKLIKMQVNSRSILFPAPELLWRFLFRCYGKPQLVDKLLCDLAVSNQKAKSLIGWQPESKYWLDTVI